VLVLQHPSESGHALNTGRLAVLGLENAQLLVGEHFDELLADWAHSHDPALLFPDEQALCLADVGTVAVRPLLLIVPDGTWRKARKLLHLNPLLAALPRVSLPEGPVSRYRLRKAPMPGALSTVEAIATALEILEARSFAPLLAPFEKLIEGQIDAMGEATFRRNHGH
jgi:DTW domain-containing protein YfiP